MVRCPCCSFTKMLAKPKKIYFIRCSLFCCVSSSIAFFSISDSALALPFKSNAAAFESYASTRTWYDGNQRVFSQFYNCSFPGRYKKVYSGLVNEYDKAFCGGGYVSIYSPQGTKVCKLSSRGVEYERVLIDDGVPVSRNGKLYFGIQDCVMR